MNNDDRKLEIMSTSPVFPAELMESVYWEGGNYCLSTWDNYGVLHGMDDTWARGWDFCFWQSGTP